MTAAEKKAFKRDARFWGEPAQGLYYVRLFDALNDYLNSDQVKPQHKRLTTFLSARFKEQEMGQIGPRIPYLYEKLLESMRFLHPSKQSVKYLNALIQDAHFLLQKELHEECMEKVSEAKALAKALDRPGYLIELSFWDHRLRSVLQQADGKEHIRQREVETDEAIQHLKDILQVALLSNQTAIAYLTGATLPLETQMQVRQYFNRPTPEGYPDQQFSRVRYYALTSIEYLATYYKKRQEVWEDLPAHLLHSATAELLQLPQKGFGFRQDEGFISKNLETRRWNQFLLNGQYDELEVELEKALKTEDEFFLFKEVLYMKAQIYISRGDYEQAMEYLRQSKAYSSFLKFQNRIQPSRLMAISFVAFYVSILLKDYKSAALWVQNVLDDPNYHLRSDLRMAAFFTHAISTAQLKGGQSGRRALKNLKTEVNNKAMKLSEEERAYVQAISSILYPLFDPKKPPKSPESLIVQCEELKHYFTEKSIPEPYQIPLVWVLSTLKGTSMTHELQQI